jgi:endonuclease-8
VPEGDTIRRAAGVLHAALAGRTLSRLASREARVTAAAAQLAVVGRAIVAVESRGKHLLVLLDGGAALHTHLGMHGRWNIARPPVSGGASAVLEADGVFAVCRRAAIVELLSARELARHPALARLGPDVLADGFDLAAARARLRACGDRPVGEALLDQSVLAGIGNVYKSEVLFVCRVWPLELVRALDDATLERLLAAARRLMRANLGPGPRRTTSALSPVPLNVYQRGGRPCRRCGARIARIVQGEHARATWFCPGCQARAVSPGEPR